MPIENAKETVQRYIDRHAAATVTGLQGVTVTYESDCEVYWDFNDFGSAVYDADYFYFGYLFFPVDTTVQETSLNLTVNDNNGTRMDTVNCTLFGMSQSFTPVMFNEVLAAPTSFVYFIGYKFKLV